MTVHCRLATISAIDLIASIAEPTRETGPKQWPPGALDCPARRGEMQFVMAMLLRHRWGTGAPLLPSRLQGSGKLFGQTKQ